MSNIYIQEPPTSGKVLLKTTAGDIDIELWSKECPKTCRNFIQLCLEGYYEDTIFHRVVRNFIVQGGDPRGDGTGGESVYGEPFKDEFHQRLRFNRRGLVAMANAGKDDNGSQFFFTLGATPELQNKHSLFGKVTGDTVFNMLKLAEGVIEDETPLYPYKIVKTEVLNNPFPDIIPRELKPKKEIKEKKKKENTPGVKNFKLLSFGEEAEEDEEQTTRENEKFSTKGKSSHDVLNDPKLSADTEHLATNSSSGSDTEQDTEKQLENIRKKLKSNKGKAKPGVSKQKSSARKVDEHVNDDEKDLDEYYLGKDRDMEKKRKLDELKKEMQDVKKEYHKNKLKKEDEDTKKTKKEKEKSEVVKEFEDEYNKYRDKKKALPKKGSGREEFTLQLLESFKKKLRDAKEKEEHDSDDEKEKTDEKEDRDDNAKEKDDDDLFSHKLRFSDNLVLAKDANTKDDDWFEIYDPRNPLNKRRRGESSNKPSKK